MELYRILNDVIDLRSFSNLWYWIGLAVVWSSASRWVLGVPYEMVQRGRRQGGQTALDVETMVAINCRRVLGLSRAAAVPIFFAAAFLITVIAMLAFYYNVEFAQALFFLLAPMLAVGWLNVAAAARIDAGENRGEPLYHRLLTLRRKIQVLGMSVIFVTAMFGMWRNLNMSVLY